MNRRASPMFLRVSIGLGLATAVLTSAARADPGMLTNLGIGARPNPATSTAGAASAERLPAAGQSGGSAVKPSTSPATTAPPRIGSPATDVVPPTTTTPRPDSTQQPSKAPQPSKPQQPSKAQQAEQIQLAAISAAATTERSSWAKVQVLVKQQPTIADTSLYQEMVQFQKTVPTSSELTAAGSSTSTPASDALASQTPKERELLLQKLTTQNVVLQTLLVQASEANLGG